MKFGVCFCKTGHETKEDDETTADVKMEQEFVAASASRDLKATKKLSLFKQTSDNDFSDLHESCYNLCLCIVTSNGRLLAVVLNASGDFVQEDCNILTTGDSTVAPVKTDSWFQAPNKESQIESENFVIKDAKFHWDDEGRYVSYVTSRKELRMAKYEFQLLDTNFSENGKRLTPVSFVQHEGNFKLPWPSGVRHSSLNTRVLSSNPNRLWLAVFNWDPTPLRVSEA